MTPAQLAHYYVLKGNDDALEYLLGMGQRQIEVFWCAVWQFRDLTRKEVEVQHEATP